MGLCAGLLRKDGWIGWRSVGLGGRMDGLSIEEVCDTASSFPRRPPSPDASAAVPGRLRARAHAGAQTYERKDAARGYAHMRTCCAEIFLRPCAARASANASSAGCCICCRPGFEWMLCCSLERLWPRRQIVLSRLRKPNKKLRLTNSSGGFGSFVQSTGHSVPRRRLHESPAPRPRRHYASVPRAATCDEALMCNRSTVDFKIFKKHFDNVDKGGFNEYQTHSSSENLNLLPDHRKRPHIKWRLLHLRLHQPDCTQHKKNSISTGTYSSNTRNCINYSKYDER